MCLFHAFRATNEHKTSLATTEVHVAAEEVLANAMPQQLRQVQTQLWQEPFGDSHGVYHSHTQKMLNKRGATNYTSFVSRTSEAT